MLPTGDLFSTTLRGASVTRQAGRQALSGLVGHAEQRLEHSNLNSKLQNGLLSMYLSFQHA